MNEFFICKNHIHAIAIKQIYTCNTMTNSREQLIYMYLYTEKLVNFVFKIQYCIS